MCGERGYITVEASYICVAAVMLTIYIITVCLFYRDAALLLAIAGDAAVSEAGRSAQDWKTIDHTRDWERWSGTKEGKYDPAETCEAKFLYRAAGALGKRAVIGCSVKEEDGYLCLEYEGVWKSPFSVLFHGHSFALSGRVRKKTGTAAQSVRMIKGLVMGFGGG